MSKINVDTWEPESSSDATLMGSGHTVTVPSGASLVVASGATITNSGTSTGFGATNNIQRATGDVTIATTANYDVDGKSAMIVSANAAAANRTITLCPVGETGMDACVITVICDADATSTYELKVVESDGTTEVWTGFQKGDFVQLVVSNSAWLVVAHKETMFSSRYLTSDLSVAASAVVKPTGYTNVIDIGKVWDDTNNKLVSSFTGFWTLNWRLANNYWSGHAAVIYVGGSQRYSSKPGNDSLGGNYGQNMASMRVEVAASTDIEFYDHNCWSNGAQTLMGGSDKTQFDGTFTRTY